MPALDPEAPSSPVLSSPAIVLAVPSVFDDADRVFPPMRACIVTSFLRIASQFRKLPSQCALPQATDTDGLPLPSTFFDAYTKWGEPAA